MADIESEQGQYSVCQFFEDGTHEYVRRFVNERVAAKATVHYTTSVAARLGMTNRVIITDGGDCIVFEWIFGKGIVFPTKDDAPKLVAALEDIQKPDKKEL